MANVSFQLTDSTQGCAKNLYCYPAGGTIEAGRKAIEGSTAGNTEVSLTITSNTSNQAEISFEIDPDDSYTWNGGTWTVRFDLTTAANNVDWDTMAVCRVNSSCTNQETLGTASALNITCSTVGVRSANVTCSASTGVSAGDKAIVILGFSNTNLHTNRTIGITPNQLIDTTIDDGATGGAIQDSISGRGIVPWAR